MSQLINQERVLEILRYIENKELFIRELLEAINQSVAARNPQIIEDCLDEWEASAELNSIPKLDANVKKRYQLLVKAGLINAD
jgi:3-methyladenine DNA glycosylase AlkC